MRCFPISGLLAFTLATTAFGAAPVTRITVDVSKPGHEVSPLLHGIFFEDINYGADGGLYAELVQNRSFEHDDNLFSWAAVRRGGAEGTLAVATENPLNGKNPHYVRLTVTAPGKGFGAANSGFGGIAVKANENYFLSVRARGDLALKAVLEDETGRPLGECTLAAPGPQWRQLEGTIRSTATAAHTRLVVIATAAGLADLDVVSLFPEHTWKDRRNGLRADLVQMLADMHPAFLRFPGGCIVEGKDLLNRYQWKDTIGDVADRPQNWNRWQDAVRLTAPNYYQTYGLGFFEYFQLCEDIGAAPLPIINCGMACQFQSKQLVPLSELDPFVQDALDLIEFANGPVTSTWGAKRAALGHPAPFGMKMIGVGNEQWGEEYFERYPIFYKAIKAKYPDMQIVTGAGPGVDAGDQARWKLAWDKFKGGTPADIVDEHFYRSPQWFLDNVNRYDTQDRNGPKIFAGEFAAHDGRAKKNTLRAAIAEAAIMTGFVRNSDVVTMTSYAPLFAKEGAWQWNPDLIWFDNTRVYGSPSYHVQALFARNRPDVVLPAMLNPAPAAGGDAATAKPSLYVVAGLDRKTGETILDVVNATDQTVAAQIELQGGARLAPEARAVVLTSASADDENSLDAPNKVAPREETVKITGSSFPHNFPANSLTILRLKPGN